METLNIIILELAKQNLVQGLSSCTKISHTGCHIMVFTAWKQHENFLCN